MKKDASLEELETSRQKLVTLLEEVNVTDADVRTKELKVVHDALKIIDELIAEKRKE